MLKNIISCHDLITFTDYAYAKNHYHLTVLRVCLFVLDLFVSNGHSSPVQRFPGRGHVLGSSDTPPPPPVRAPVLSGSRRPKPSNNQTDLQARLLDPTSPVSSPEVPQQNPSTTRPNSRLFADYIT